LVSQLQKSSNQYVKIIGISRLISRKKYI